MRQMAESSEYFLSTCGTLFERMINTVPKGVQLTDVIYPIPVKPRFMKVEVIPGDAAQVTVSGRIRVRTPYESSQGSIYS